MNIQGPLSRFFPFNLPSDLPRVVVPITPGGESHISRYQDATENPIPTVNYVLGLEKDGQIFNFRLTGDLNPAITNQVRQGLLMLPGALLKAWSRGTSHEHPLKIYYAKNNRNFYDYFLEVEKDYKIPLSLGMYDRNKNHLWFTPSENDFPFYLYHEFGHALSDYVFYFLDNDLETGSLAFDVLDEILDQHRQEQNLALDQHCQQENHQHQNCWESYFASSQSSGGSTISDYFADSFAYYLNKDPLFKKADPNLYRSFDETLDYLNSIDDINPERDSEEIKKIFIRNLG